MRTFLRILLGMLIAPMLLPILVLYFAGWLIFSLMSLMSSCIIFVQTGEWDWW